mmetsp:Transcript_61702/g.74238  ORF Transcript_61702/g.74238 Transcript_61702/m.74238 type:complete len:86 (-) Transcript_61702:424-681(-)
MALFQALKEGEDLMKRNSLDGFFLPPRAQNPGDGRLPKIVSLFVMVSGGPLTRVSFDPAPHFPHWFWGVVECFFYPRPLTFSFEQ